MGAAWKGQGGEHSICSWRYRLAIEFGNEDNVHFPDQAGRVPMFNDPDVSCEPIAVVGFSAYSGEAFYLLQGEGAVGFSFYFFRFFLCLHQDSF